MLPFLLLNEPNLLNSIDWMTRVMNFFYFFRNPRINWLTTDIGLLESFFYFFLNLYIKFFTSQQLYIF